MKITKITKRILACLLLTVFLASLFIVTSVPIVNATQEYTSFEIGDIEYAINQDGDNTLTVVGYKGTSTSIGILSTVTNNRGLEHIITRVALSDETVSPSAIEIIARDRQSLKEFDVSGFTNLQKLNCYNSNLYDLDVSNLKNLTYLNCCNNNLRSLDVSNLTNLTELACNGNDLIKLNTDGCTNLQSIDLTSNNLDTIRCK